MAHLQERVIQRLRGCCRFESQPSMCQSVLGQDSGTADDGQNEGPEIKNCCTNMIIIIHLARLLFRGIEQAPSC